MAVVAVLVFVAAYILIATERVPKSRALLLADLSGRGFCSGRKWNRPPVRVCHLRMANKGNHLTKYSFPVLRQETSALRCDRSSRAPQFIGDAPGAARHQARPSFRHRER